MDNEWPDFTTCDECGEKIKRGIVNTLNHYKEKHGLQQFADALITARIVKGKALTLEEVALITKLH